MNSGSKIRKWRGGNRECRRRCGRRRRVTRQPGADLRERHAFDADLFSRMVRVVAGRAIRIRVRQMRQRMRKPELLDRDQQAGQQDAEVVSGSSHGKRLPASAVG
ncbi:MAG: hypothetical protein IPI73_29930 [Betaproteobacteria bacterium]|nr:hypothetical protein [Betaproteobacteria bacterium]